ncbi:precorrin-2 dehydrogenase/sirohydrochlorin ferrochelatase family protein [Parablastomonas sp. CN1-191]|uniref:precorrin-2 dehydrogenase/sirohydrochlorin ferrochelatase family protein n=1 Tax=Parablastomonas sp. CN1-191 TaxID=3400908 RepID=UPI003BF86994
MTGGVLPLFHRVAGRPVIVAGEGEAADAKRRLVERMGGLVVAANDSAARLAFVAGDDAENLATALRSRGLLVNVVDRPELCDFTTPSLLQRGAVTVAVGTGGVSAGLAKALRLRLDALLPATLGDLAAALGGARAALRRRWPDAADRRRALDAALVEGGPLDPLADYRGGIGAWIGGAPHTGASVQEFIFTGADPDDLTLRQARWLGTADMVAHEPGLPAGLLDRARADAVRTALAPGAPAPTCPGRVVVIRTAR